IRSVEDSEDVKDELWDRFGRIPKAVLGLINIALIRNRAHAMGIYEIRQTDNAILLFVKELKSPAVADLLIALNGKASLNAGAKPHVAVKCAPGAAAIPALKRIFKLNE
ncbi:MAG: hypothetical protein II224_00285, partial [Ruminococcus sp.]|nr:hypothetical protein [Ruminococcus sp.]